MRTITKQKQFLMRAALILLIALPTAQTTWANSWTNAGGTGGSGTNEAPYYVNMPATGTKTVTIPAGVQSFKVYDDGGSGGQYRWNCDGTLILTAPEGYVLQLSGSIITQLYEDYLTVYDGDNNQASTLLNRVSSYDSYGTERTIDTVISSGRSMTIYFYSNNLHSFDGLNLTVKLVTPGVTVNTTTGGSVAATVGEESASTAKWNDVVTLTATPSEGYVLCDLSVKDDNDNDVAVTDMLWYTGTNTATFTMPASSVTVTPTFTNTWTTDGGLYINMPKSGTKTATIPAGIQSFKVYDDGGASGKYSNLCDGYLTLIAPEGYVLQLAGSIKTENKWDFLTVCDGNDASVLYPRLLNEVSSTTAFGNEKTITPVVSSGQSMTLWFHSDYRNEFEGLGQFDGLNLTVTLVDVNTQFALTVSPFTGGSVATTVGEQTASTAKVNDVVTLTATPSDGYLLRDLSVKDGSGYGVAVTDMLWYTGTNTATFTMPASATTITPTFTNTLTADGGLYINMPATGTTTVTIPAGVQSFKVYDDGGSGGQYSRNCDGTLTLTAPEGYVLQLAGSIKTEKKWDYLTVYDGTDTSAATLLNEVSSTSDSEETTITTVISTGQSMTLYFYADGNIYNYDGLDLTVTLFNTSTEYDITVINPATGGSVAATIGGQTASTAKLNDVVTLTATPSDGYVLWDLSVKDGNDNDVAVTDMLWYTGKNTATFTMPVSAVTVTPTFTTLTDVFVNMPKSGTKTVNIPTGLQSFKVYDDGGADGNYSDNCDGTLILTAPAGYVLQLSGSIKTQSGYDLLTVYDGGDDSAATLLNEVSSTSNGEETAITTVNSTGQSMTLWFGSGSSNNFDGLDLTVTLIDINTEFTLTVSPTTGGSVAATVDGQTSSTPKVNDVVTLTATPSEGYLLCDLSINGNNVSVTDMLWYTGTNTATFTMPASATTVTPTFTNTLTADGGLYVNMPKSGTTTATIPAGVQSFKLYDDGGMSDIYSNLCDGVLILTAPAGYMLQLAGSIRTQKDYDYLTVYDGSDTSASKLLDAVSSTSSDTETTINTVSSSGQSMTLLFYSNGYRNYDGLDLTVTLVKIMELADNADNTEVINGWQNGLANVTLSGRTLYKDGDWNTLCLPFDVTVADSPLSGDNVVAKVLDAGESSLDSNGKLTLKFTDAPATISAGTPFIIKWDNTGVNLVSPVFAGVTIKNAPASVAFGDGNASFVGTYSPFDITNANKGYILLLTGGGKLGYSKVARTLGSCRAYFNTNGANAAREFVIDFGEGTTALTLVNSEKRTVNSDVWYTLDGRKLQGEPTTTGIYIYNGKKVVK